MVLHLILKEFGKIQSADISLDHLVVFVGNNNSGKTMVMQLIYGIRKALLNLSIPSDGVEESTLNGQSLIRCAQTWFRAVEQYINRYLEANKESIVKDIFGIRVPVGEIQIALEYERSLSYVCSISEVSGQGEEQSVEREIVILQNENGASTKSFKSRIHQFNNPDDLIKETVRTVWRIILSGEVTSDSEQLFLPASRSGLQMLYRYYFAGETKGNMVMPIRDFMRFLQLYSDDTHIDNVRSSLLEFGEVHLLQGKILQKENETFYVEDEGEKVIPLYMASSMIHELTPFMKALSGTQRIDWLYCDEVENSLHPLLQREMARWLIRMVNAGMHVIISSHSDTMASRLNNLFMLTKLIKKKMDYTMLSELELQEADLLNSNVKVAIYEFQCAAQGKTIVEKLEFINYPLMGYDFKLFEKNLDKLYDEAERITR